ncbi:peptidase family S41-domain-containing protein, partial [Baffinella frigidus]
DTVTPLIILMDSKSASASEVLAGSLRDNCRALVAAPSNSYGKGVIQGAFPLSDGSGVIVTVAKYLTPKHTEINGVGVPYDIKLDLGRNPTKALQNGKLDFTAVDAKLAACVPPEDPSATPMPGSMKGGREGQSEDSKESLFSTRLR